MTSMDRVLVGYDGSAGADEAVGLVMSLRLPSDTIVHVVTAVPTERELRSVWGRLIVGEASLLVRELSIQAEQGLDPVRQRVSDAGLTTETAVVPGRPPQVLVEEARHSRATLVAVGSRGLGPIASTLVGSVSSEVVDKAPCPVLVARSRSIRKILFATDGSRHAEVAEQVLASLPVARQVPVRVVSVAQVIRPLAVGIAPTMYGRVYAAQAEYEAASRTARAEVAASSVTRLRSSGIEASAELRVGDPAGEVLDAAHAFQADLIVVGSRGQTGLRRLVLGSVARRVLHHSSASVLVVRH
jgi:nucleotide-binding universal stress UspA family protein